MIPGYRAESNTLETIRSLLISWLHETLFVFFLVRANQSILPKVFQPPYLQNRYFAMESGTIRIHIRLRYKPHNLKNILIRQWIIRMMKQVIRQLKKYQCYQVTGMIKQNTPLGNGPKATLTLFRLTVSETLFNNFTPMGPWVGPR